MRGATSQQAKSRSGQTAHESCRKEMFYRSKNHSDKVLMISIKFLFKDSKCGRKGKVPASSIKRNKNIFSSLIHRVYQRAIKRQWILSNFKSKYLCSMGQKAEKNNPDKRFSTANQRILQPMLHFWYKKELLNCQRSHLKPPSRDLSRTVYTAESLYFTSFSAKVKFNDYGLNLAKSLQTGTQAKKSNIALEITDKNVAKFQDPWVAVANLVFEFSGSAAVLK